MADANSITSVVCFVLFMSGLVFIYYLSKMSQYNEASELRAKRRIEDSAYYLSKMEEHIDDAEAQINKKIDGTELETRISLTNYERKIDKLIPKKMARKIEKVAAK
jgi:hypothetical protein